MKYLYLRKCSTRLPGYSAGQSRLVERDGALGLGNVCLMRTSLLVYVDPIIWTQ